jgi:hypothetical protein
MTYKLAVGVLALIALGGTAGCAEMRSAVDESNSAGYAAPGDRVTGQTRECERNGGWYDRAAGVCEIEGAP